MKKNLTDGLHWFHQIHSFVADCKTLSVVDVAVQQLCLLNQIILIEAAVLSVGLSQPDVTGLLLPFHSDDVIIWTFYQIDFLHNIEISLFLYSAHKFYSFLNLHWLFSKTFFFLFFFSMNFFMYKKLKKNSFK